MGRMGEVLLRLGLGFGLRLNLVIIYASHAHGCLVQNQMVTLFLFDFYLENKYNG